MKVGCTKIFRQKLFHINFPIVKKKLAKEAVGVTDVGTRKMQKSCYGENLTYLFLKNV